jgi:putative spermidine/putrescine transport system permease protein
MTGTVNRLHNELEGVVPPLRKPRREGEPLHKLIAAWVIFLVAAGYFLLPLLGTVIYSFKDRPWYNAWSDTVADARVWGTLGYSFLVGLLTIVLSIVLLVPTAFWVRLRMPRLRPVVEFVTLLPFVIPPIVLVYGLVITFSAPPLLLTTTEQGSNLVLVCAYVVLSFPYMYRAIDAGLRTIDIQTLTEACQSLGAGWPTIMIRVILPNLRVAILSGAFLTLAIVMGEFTIANFLARQNMFAVYLQQISFDRPYEPSAIVLMSFALTWAAMGVIGWIGRGRTDKIELAGAH